MDDSSVKWDLNKTFFVFHPILMKLGEVSSGILHQVSSKLDEKQKSFVNKPFNGCVVHLASVRR